eukprot:gene12656-12783_t
MDVGQKQFKHESAAMFCYFMLGCGFLAGWNAFLTATDFFNAERSIDRVYTIVYLPLTFTLVGLVARFPRILWTAKIRIWTAYSFFTLANAAVPLVDAVLLRGQTSAEHAQAAYALMLVFVALVALGDGLSQGTVLGDAALLPDKFTRAVVMGMSASGVVIGILRLITKGALVGAADGLRSSTYIYFACAAAITTACLGLYQLVMPRLDVVQFYRGKLLAEQAAADQAARSYSDEHTTEPAGSPRNSFIHITVAGPRAQQEVLLSTSRQPDDVNTWSHATAVIPQAMPTAASDEPHAAKGVHIRRDNASHSSMVSRAGPDAAPCSVQEPKGAAAALPVSAADVGSLTWRNIFRLNWKLCVAVFFVYAVTLSIFPGFLAENVRSAALKDWYAVLLIFTFNIFDFSGRCTPSFGWCPTQTTLLCLSLARLVMEPLYAVLAIKGASEAVFFILTAILGGSNGYLTALIFMAAPRGLSPSAAELAGMINVFCELAGLCMGAFMGWLWTV